MHEAVKFENPEKILELVNGDIRFLFELSPAEWNGRLVIIARINDYLIQDGI